MITVQTFVERLLRLGAENARPLPRKRADRQILMKSVLLTLDSARSYSETEINEALEIWNTEVAPAIETDYATMRRMLVDHGHLERTADGRAYRVGFPAGAVAFELEIDDLDLAATVATHRANWPAPRRPEPA